MKLQKIAMLCLLIPILSGCIRTKAVITSEPSAAMVTVNDQYRGRTPIDIPYIWNWWYTIKVEKEGYEPATEKVRTRAKPWVIFPLDFFAELLPFKISDTRRLHYTLKPAPEIPATAPVQGTAAALQ